MTIGCPEPALIYYDGKRHICPRINRRKMHDKPATELVGSDGKRYSVFIVNRRAFKAIREGLNLSQYQFGLILGFGEPGSRNRVSEIERGDATISRHVEALCRYIEKFGILEEDLERIQTRPRGRPFKYAERRRT